MEHKPTPWVVGGARFPSASVEDAFDADKDAFLTPINAVLTHSRSALRMGTHWGRREMVDCTIPLERS